MEYSFRLPVSHYDRSNSTINVAGEMKDYYEILGVEQDADENEIRRRYRLLAMEYHPDRNPDDPQAEEKFKEIAEAYGVLSDPVKRREYETWKKMGGAYADSNGQFQYSQEEILKDLFGDPRFQQLFQGLLREFQKSGFRASPHFVRKSFFGGRGGMFFSGLFMIGSIAGPHIMRTAKKSLPKQKSILKTVGDTLSGLLGNAQKGEDEDVHKPTPVSNDLTYVTPVTMDELRDGTVIQVVTSGPAGQELLKVTIPPGSKNGQKLRIRGKGSSSERGRGDLFLILEQK